MVLEGHYCRLERLDVDAHAHDLFGAFADDPRGELWTYRTVGPFAAFSAFKEWCRGEAASEDPRHYTVVDLASGKASGTASFLRINPPHGSIEVGHIGYAPRLQRTRAATEAMYLMMRYAFDDLGYRRYEWKCDALNEPSRRAAERYGFTFEGVHRQALINKGRNRDTAWYSILDKEWPLVKSGFESWLDPQNFEGDGKQRATLKELRTALAQGL